jgi:hypothetical protein
MADRCGALVTVENQGPVAMKSRRGSGRMHTTTRAVCVPGSPRRSGRRSSLEIRSPSRVDGWMGPLSATTLQKRRCGNRASQAVQCRGRSTSIILLFALSWLGGAVVIFHRGRLVKRVTVTCRPIHQLIRLFDPGTGRSAGRVALTCRG